MGREIRRVPPNWEHPVYTADNASHTSDIGGFIPMYDQSFKEAAEEWKQRLLAWERGERECYFKKDKYPSDYQFWEWDGGPPDRESYRPEFTEEPTWYQVYETVSEGTPCSPPFETKEELIQYLMTEGGLHRQEYPDLFPLLTREQAVNFVNSEWAPSMVIDSSGIHSGIEVCQPSNSD